MRILIAVLLYLCDISSSSKPYCQPSDECWPTPEEVSVFSSLLSPMDDECMGLPSLSYPGNEGDPIRNYWYPEVPDMITPYELGNLRNRVTADDIAYFVVIARNTSDVTASVQFAAKHNLGISVFSTGHEFNDRNAGPGTNSLLIRTTCLDSVNFDLDEENQFGWRDGVVRLGAGLTWGTSKFGGVGVHELAEEHGRVVVSGHAGNVGVVGWSLGGGHGQLVGVFGMGVDQVLQVELVGADGSLITSKASGTTIVSPDGGLTEETNDASLFWALRGGGAGPWGVVTAITIKLHKPRDDCESNCYTMWDMVWEGDWAIDDGKVGLDLIQAYLSWTATSSKYWSSYGYIAPSLTEGSKYYFSLMEALYVGREEDSEDFRSLEKAMENVHPDKRVINTVRHFDTFLEKLSVQVPESVNVDVLQDPMVSVLVNTSIAQNPSYTQTLVDNWMPRCYRNGFGPACIYSYLIMHTLSTSEEDDDYTDSAVSLPFRRAKVHVSSLGYLSFGGEMSLEERAEFAHEVVGPAMYEYSEGSYYSESEYTLEGDAWKWRFWGWENYMRLLEIKRIWDPTFVFNCKHCVGDMEEPGQVGPTTLPSWRYPDLTSSCFSSASSLFLLLLPSFLVLRMN